MLVIRQEQINQMIMGDEEEFVAFLVRQVKEEHPEIEEERDEEALRAMVRGGIRRAESHRFVNADDIAAFVAVMFEIAPNFDEQKEIRAVLDDHKTPANQRLEKLWSPVVPDEAWDEARDNYDEDAWFPATPAEEKAQ